MDQKKALIKNVMFCSLCLASRSKNHQCSVQSCARCHASHNVLLCPEDPPEKSLLSQEEMEEDGDDDLIDSYLTNTDPEAANLVIEEKVLLARERGSDTQAEEERSEESDNEFIRERDSDTQAEEKQSEESDDEFITPGRTGEKILIPRELPEEKEEEPESASENEEENMITSSDSVPVRPSDRSRAVTLEPRDRNGSCHPLLCGKEGARRCFVEEFMAIKKVHKVLFKDQST